MKKTIMILIGIVFVFLVTACSSHISDKRDSEAKPSTEPQNTDSEEPTVTPTVIPQKVDDIIQIEGEETEEENSIETFVPDRIAELHTLREKLNPDYISSINSFSVKLSNILLKEQKVNTAISPISIQMALSLAATGAKGTTEKELFEALSLENSGVNELSEQNELLYRLLNTEDRITKLKLANSLWLGGNTKFQEDYLKKAKDHYFAALYEADFTDPATGNLMSDWIYENTGKLIKPEMKLDSDQILTIINTIYYKDEWIDDFDRKKTKPGTFYLEDGSEVECDYMFQTHASYEYVKGDDYICTSLHLKGNASMYFILPEEGGCIEELLSDPEVLQEALFSEQQQRAKIDLQIPKFSFGSKYELIEILKKLGISEAFQPEADFSGIADIDPLYISKIEHQAHIGIDENGVEAAAFTDIAYMGAAPATSSEIVDFKLNRPFLFAIMKEDVILFIGAVYNPLNH